MAKAVQMGREAVEREELAQQAKQNLVSQYLHLGSCMKRCSHAVEAYSHAINDAYSVEEIRELLKAPMAGHMPGGMPSDFPFLSNGKAIKKRDKSADSDEDILDANGKKKKRKSKKADKDPNAPRRPMSAYLMFQNKVRQEMKEKNPDIPYRELVAQVGEAWKQLGENGQKSYKDAADILMANWKMDSANYASGKDGSMVIDGDDALDAALVENAIVPKEVKKEKKPKETKEAKVSAVTAVPASKKDVNGTVPAPTLAVKERKPSKKDTIPVPVSKAAMSTPSISKGGLPPKPAATKKSQPVQPIDTSSSSGEEDEDESSSDDD